MWREAQGWRGSPHASGAFWSTTAVLLLRLGLAAGIISCTFSPAESPFHHSWHCKGPKIAVVPYSSTSKSRPKQKCSSGSFPPLKTSRPLQASDRMIETSGVNANYHIPDAGLLQTVGFYDSYGKPSPHSEPVASSCSGFPETMTVQLTGDL